ncbi:G-type lectin S-receptor-like serine/threonine-protein kinase SD1-13 [Castanea sativa]|uniref:G-type lectin S-receptor-like serine/threonine-protein kinase SD1-13 n=1 Tax=Castanea sativa TaxID=21020 RepID=UPI003F64CD73
MVEWFGALVYPHKTTPTRSIEQVMGLVRNTSMSVLIVLLCCFCLDSGSATNTITSFQPFKDYIISNGSAFKLGFFSPVYSTNRYLGIWFDNISIFTAVWIANRQKPLKDSSRFLSISEDSNLVVLVGQMEILWSSNVTKSFVNSSAQLLNSGNLVLRESTTGTIIWESFQHPSNTFLSMIKPSTNVITGKKVLLTSWTSPSDLSAGSFSVGIQPLSLPQAFIWKDGSPYWGSGPWNSRAFTGISYMDSVYLDGFSLVDDHEGTSYLSFNFANKTLLSNFDLNSQGNLVLSYWYDGNKDWKKGGQLCRLSV